MPVVPSLASSLYDFNTTFRFLVIVDGINSGAFTEFQLPTLTVETQDIKEGGQNAYVHKLPVRTTPGTVTLKHGVLYGSELFAWYMQVMRGEMADATRQVVVAMFDISVDQEPIMIWGFFRAYPIKWSGPALKADDRAVAIETIEFVHHGFIVE
ncbi:MAG: phage tail protein [Burkholderiales bacterium]|nr:phage tail protein [Anaerolineae bacterium]